MAKRQIYGRESVGVYQELTLADSSGQPIDITNYEFGLALTRQRGTIDLNLGMAATVDDAGFTVLDGAAGSYALTIPAADLAAISDTTGAFVLRGELLATPPGGDPEWIEDIWLTVEDGAFGSSSPPAAFAQSQAVMRGKSNYELWLADGNVGTLQDFLDSNETAAAAARDVAVEAAGEAETLVAAATAAASNIYRTKADLLADFDNIANDATLSVLADETKGGTWSLYYKAFNALEYLFSFSGTTDESEAATGIFFDTSAGDLFTDLITPADASLTVTGPQIAFSSASAVNLDSTVKDSAGNAMKFCFDYFEVDMTVTVHSFPVNGAEGVMAARVNDVLGLYGGAVRAHGGSTTQLLPSIVGTSGSTRATAGSGQAFTNPYSVRMRYRREGATAKAIYNYAGGADNTLSYTMVFAATSFELPRMFSTAGLRFRQGVLDVTALKVSASYPNARFAFLGDSLTQGRISTAYEDGFAAKVRADYPTEVLLAGAPAAKAADWMTNAHMEPFVKMKPRHAFILLGTNDVLNGVSLGTFQTNYGSIIDTLVAADIIPIVLSIPPNGSASVATWNAWLSSQGWRYIDIYTPLLGTGSSMNAAYNSGDGIHPNTAGHAVIYSAVAAYITAEL